MRTLTPMHLIALATLVLVGVTSCRGPGGNGIITTVAGDGWMDDFRDGRYHGDGGPATEASLYNPRGLALGPDGSLYIADEQNHRVRRVQPNGIITTVAGNGQKGYSGDGGPAIDASLDTPGGVAVGADGSVYIAEYGGHRVRKVNSNGTITTVAGNGQRGYSGDGGAATKASLRNPCGIAVGPDGSLYIADTVNHRIRKVDPKGIIRSVAGSGECGTRGGGYGGDGGPATEASLNLPAGIALGADGSLYVADHWNHCIRKVNAAGTITTIAGNAQRGYGGDGGRALDASLFCPTAVAPAADGSLYIADTFNHLVRKVDPSGIITTVAGDGWAVECEMLAGGDAKCGRFAGDGGPATEASLFWPGGLALGADGSLYIADNMNHRIRKVTFKP